MDTDPHELLAAFHSHPSTVAAVQSATDRVGIPCRIEFGPAGIRFTADDLGTGPISIEPNADESKHLQTALADIAIRVR